MKLHFPKSWFKSRLDREEGEIGAGSAQAWHCRPPRPVRCGRTRKVCYRTHDAAILAAADIMARPDCRVNMFRAYRCSYCALWHLTSK